MDLDKIHYRTLSRSVKKLLEEINEVAKAGVGTIRINATHFKAEVLDELEDVLPSEIKLIFENPPHDFDVPLHCGIHSTGAFESIKDLRKSKSGQLIGATGISLADCKNLDLLKLSYLEIPLQINYSTKRAPMLGLEGIAALIPKETEYGWVIMSMNTPVFASGIRTLQEVKDLARNTKIHGVIVDQFLYSEKNKAKMIKTLKAVL
jgi:hypothetical protein